MTQVHLEFRPHRLNGGWLRTFTRPYTQIDSNEYLCDWAQPVTVEIDPGEHVIRTFIRYKRVIPGNGGQGERVITIPETGEVTIVSSNFWTNGSPFIPRVAPN